MERRINKEKVPELPWDIEKIAMSLANTIVKVKTKSNNFQENGKESIRMTFPNWYRGSCIDMNREAIRILPIIRNGCSKMSQEIDERIAIVVKIYAAIEKIRFFAKIHITIKEIKNITK
jgi:hypothetical protein